MNFAIIASAILLVVIFFLGIYFLMERYSNLKEREWMFGLKRDNNKALASLKITAYERLIVMLERSTPTSLVMRHSNISANASTLQLEIIRAIREEFEHNISLQMYVSEFCWQQVTKAKDETTALIKIAYSKLKPEATSADLSRELFILESATGNSAIKAAIVSVRHEMEKYF